MNPIGVFDSGLGGLTVLKELQSLLPNENFLYFGDTAHVPYGNKSAETVVRYSVEIANFLIEQNIKLLVIACNTASAYALQSIRALVDIPVIGVIEPGAKTAVAASANQKIAVLGTKATIKSQAYQSAIGTLSPGAEIFLVSCPLFVPLVEENYLEKPAARLIVRDYLSPIKRRGIDAVLLGCTHYPLIKKLIQLEMGSGITLVDSAVACAQQTKEVLEQMDLLNDFEKTSDRYFVSDDPENFKRTGELFLRRPIDHVETISELWHNVNR